MPPPRSAAEQARRVQVRLRFIQHFEQVTRNVSRTCRFFGISRSQFYDRYTRYREAGIAGLRDLKRGPTVSPWRTPPDIEALVLRLRQERQYGVVRLSLFLHRYHQIYVSPPTIYRILKEHHVPRVSQKRYRPGPSRRRDIRIPGQSIQVDVKHLKLEHGRRGASILALFALGSCFASFRCGGISGSMRSGRPICRGSSRNRTTF